jgi:hypothetical protein
MGFWQFILLLSAMSTLSWVATTWIKARHGYPIEDSPETPGQQRMDAICTENRQLKTRIATLEERLAVLERIATDPAERTAREIELLR